MNDTWLYDLRDNRWMHLDIRDGPPPNSHQVMAYDKANDVVLMFSRDGTWILKISGAP
jgi:hypothetical protein